MAYEPAAVSMVRYAERIGYNECAFFGVRPLETTGYACREIWTKPERDLAEWALREAQEELEAELNYPIVPRWIAGEWDPARTPFLVRWGHVLEVGVLDDALISAAETVNYLQGGPPAVLTDPALVGPIDPGDCDPAEMHLFHVNTDLEVLPSAVAVDAVTGEVTFSVPWCRLVAPALQDNPPEGWRYADVLTWGAPEVDVRCLSTDPSTQAVFRCEDPCNICASTEVTGCLSVRNSVLGVMAAQRADYVGTSWVRRSLCCPPMGVSVNYKAGLAAPSRQAEDALIRLAHSKMPEEPCGCDVTQRLWKRDRNVPQVLTRERANCPFGISEGSWIAWRFAQTMRLVRGGVL